MVFKNSISNWKSVIFRKFPRIITALFNENNQPLDVEYMNF